MKKKELLKRIEALESIVKPIADLQKASEKAKELECKIDLSKGPYSTEVMKYYLQPVSDDVANAFLDRFKTEEKKKLEVGKWYKGIGSFMFCFNGTYEHFTQYGFNYIGQWSKYLGVYEKEKYTEATTQEVEEALIKEAKKRGVVNGSIGNNSNIHNKKLENCELFFKNEFKFNEKENTLRVVLDYETTWAVFKDGKWAEIVEEKQYTPKIGDVVMAWECDSDNDFMIGVLKQIDESDSPYYVNTTWCYKIEPITDENIIKLFN